MRLLIAVGVLLIVSTTAHACNKEWIKIMVMNVCSYSKRHVTTNEIRFQKWTLQEIDNEFTRIYGDLEEGDESLWKIGESVESTEWKEPGRNRRSRMKRYSTLNHGYFNLGDLERFLREHDNAEEQLVDAKLKVKREIRKLIEKCCKTLCTVEDLRGICH